MGKFTTSNQVFSCYSSPKKLNRSRESILMKATYTDINLSNSMESWFYLTYYVTLTCSSMITH